MKAPKKKKPATAVRTVTGLEDTPPVHEAGEGLSCFILPENYVTS